MEKLLISLATCELLSISSDADSAPDEINSCIDWVTTWGSGPWTGLTQLRDEVSDWNAFSRVRSCPLRQEIFCKLEIFGILIWTLVYRQLTPKSIFSSCKHGSQSPHCDWTPKKDLEVLPFMLPRLCSLLGEMLTPVSTEQCSSLAPSTEWVSLEWLGTAGPQSYPGLCYQSHDNPLLSWPWGKAALIAAALQIFSMPMWHFHFLVFQT